MIREVDLATNLKLFEKYNAERTLKAFQVAEVPTKIAVQVVPFLFENNHPSLPGYQDGMDALKVIPFYKLTSDSRKAVLSVFKNFHLPEKKQSEYNGNMYGGASREKPLIESLMLMGSVGTVAQNEKSDFDYWVVLDESRLSEKELDYLRNKLTAIEKWGDKVGVELHFFLTDSTRVLENKFGSADKESAGSSQAALLKEEFYRTALHVAGKYPIWWLTAPGTTDDVYKEVLETVPKCYSIHPDKFVDLGNLHTIPEKELFGAALWQINKAIDSPFKSVLKMAMLESFTDDEWEGLFLCDELKKNLYAKDSDRPVDPYLLLIDGLLEFYSHKKRADVVDLLRKCFYNKVHIKIQLDSPARENPGYKESIMLSYVKEWGWDEKTTNDMNNYDSWNFERMSKLGSQLHGFLLETYKRLTDNLKKKEQNETMISEADLTILGRKLFSFYGKKTGKIELIKKASDDALRLESVTFSPLITRGKAPVWNVMRGNVTTLIARGINMNDAIVKKGTLLPEVISWLVVNNVVDVGTFFHLVSSPLPVSLNEIQSLVKKISQFMPNVQISSIDNTYLAHRAKVTKLLVIANFHSKDWTKSIDEVTIMFRNSHGESFVSTFPGEEGMQRAATIYANAYALGIENPTRFFDTFMPELENTKTLEKLLKNTILTKMKQIRQSKNSVES